MVSIRTSIFGRPRLVPRDRRASQVIARPPPTLAEQVRRGYGQERGAPFDQIGYGARIREDEIVGET
jgi:hypothetical protein